MLGEFQAELSAGELPEAPGTDGFHLSAPSPGDAWSCACSSETSDGSTAQQLPPGWGGVGDRPDGERRARSGWRETPRFSRGLTDRCWVASSQLPGCRQVVRRPDPALFRPEVPCRSAPGFRFPPPPPDPLCPARRATHVLLHFSQVLFREGRRGSLHGRGRDSVLGPRRPAQAEGSGLPESGCDFGRDREQMRGTTGSRTAEVETSALPFRLRPWGLRRRTTHSSTSLG